MDGSVFSLRMWPRRSVYRKGSSAESDVYKGQYADRFRSFYRERERKITNVDERLRCYYCHIALDSFKFYAKTNQITPYRWMVERIKALLNN